MQPPRRRPKTSSWPGRSVPAAVLVGGPGYSNISNLSGSPSFLVGGSGNNQIAGGTGNDTIYGHATVNYASPDSWQSYGANGWTLSLGGVQATDSRRRPA